MNIIFCSYDISNYSTYHMSNISNFLAQKHGYKTTLYCDEKSSNILKTIPYNEIKLLPQKIMNEIPRGLWSLSKIVALSEIKEPSLVIDLDLFLFKCLDEEKLNNDIVFLHDENYSHYFTKPILEYCENLVFDKVRHLKSDISKNCGIIGGRDFRTIANVSKEIIELVIQNKDEWALITSPEAKEDFQKKYTINWDPDKEDENALYVPTLLIEQIWMFDLFKLHRKDIVIKPYYDTTTTFSSQSIIDGLYHVWGLKQPFMYSIMEKFSETEIDYDKPYKDFNYSVSFLENFEKRQKQNYLDTSTEESFLEKFDLNE